MTTLKNKILAGLFGLSMVGSLALAMPAKAEPLNLWSDIFSQEGIGYDAFNDTGLGKKDPRVIAAGVIRTLLGFIGVIAVILILFGGFKYMTSQGNQTKIDESMKIIRAGVVGLLITLAAFALSIFITRALQGVTGAENSTTYENDYSAPRGGTGG